VVLGEQNQLREESLPINWISILEWLEFEDKDSSEEVSGVMGIQEIQVLGDWEAVPRQVGDDVARRLNGSCSKQLQERVYGFGVMGSTLEDTQNVDFFRQLVTDSELQHETQDFVLLFIGLEEELVHLAKQGRPDFLELAVFKQRKHEHAIGPEKGGAQNSLFEYFCSLDGIYCDVQCLETEREVDVLDNLLEVRGVCEFNGRRGLACDPAFEVGDILLDVPLEAFLKRVVQRPIPGVLVILCWFLLRKEAEEVVLVGSGEYQRVEES
jgi:hypothetical protein